MAIILFLFLNIYRKIRRKFVLVEYWRKIYHIKGNKKHSGRYTITITQQWELKDYTLFQLIHVTCVRNEGHK